MIKFGIISTARANKNSLLFPAHKRDDVSICAIASRSLEKAETYSKIHQIPKFYDSYDKLLDDKDVDAVYISLPNAVHKEYIKKALQKNKHVLCEKPLVSSWKSGVLLKELAEKQGCLLFEGVHYFYYPIIRELINLLQNGVLGKIKKLEVHLGCSFPSVGDIRLQPKMHGGALMHLGCYCLHFANKVLKGQKLEVKNVISEKHKDGVDILSFISLQSKETAVEVRCSLKEVNITSTIKIWGEKGCLKLTNPFNPTIIFGSDVLVQQVIQVMSIESQELNINFPDYKKTTYDFQLDAFISALKTKNFKPEIHLEVYRLMEEIKQFQGYGQDFQLVNHC